MDPNDAVHLIKMCIEHNWDVLVFATMHQDDHASDDWSPLVTYNRKTDNYSTIFHRMPRFQGILLGAMNFLNVGAHDRKSLVNGDYKRTSSEFRLLLLDRNARTVLVPCKSTPLRNSLLLFATHITADSIST
jgi:hypothetical protein